MTHRLPMRKLLPIFASLILVAAYTLLLARTPEPRPRSTTEPPSTVKVIRYIREKFGVSEAVPVVAEPFRDSAHAGFYETTVTVGEGKDKNSTKITVSKDGRFLVLGNFFDLGADPRQDIARHIHEYFKLPDTVKVTVGPLRDSTYPGFYETTVTAGDGVRKQKQNYFVTRDRRTLVLGNIFNMTLSPRVEALRSISTVNQPSAGPQNAPVTIVEFADLECPTCARLHEFIEKDLLPKYGDKVRVIFKEFPLVQAHQWALTAAIASQCAYRINPTAYLPYRSLIFQHQSGISAANARDALIQYGEEAGLNRVQLAACLDSRATLARVEENMREGQLLAVTRTPTSFVNGVVVVGATPEDVYKAVDEALNAPGARSGRSSESGGGAGQLRHPAQARQKNQ